MNFFFQFIVWVLFHEVIDLPKKFFVAEAWTFSKYRSIICVNINFVIVFGIHQTAAILLNQLISKKVILFPEMGRVKKILSLTRPHSRMCIRIYIFDKKKKKQGKKKEKKLKKKRLSVEYLNGIWWYRLRIFTFSLLDESWISLGCSHEFNVVYVQREKSQYLLYYNNIWSTHFQEQK